MWGEAKALIRPFYFSPPVQRLMGHGSRLASQFLFEKKAKDRLKALFTRLPEEFSASALSNLDGYFEACLAGRGVGPAAYFEMARWLGGGAHSILNSPLPVRGVPVAARKKSAKKLKLLFVSGSYPSRFHGGGLRLADLLELLAENHEVSLYCFRDPASEGEAELGEWKFLKSLKVVNDPISFKNDFGSWIKERAETPFDAVHFMWQASAELMPEARPHARRLIYEYVECVTRRAAISLAREVERGKGLTARPIYDLLSSFRLESAGTRNADETIAVVPQDLQFARAVFGGEKGQVIPTCLSEKYLWAHLDPQTLPPANQDALFLGFFGHTPNVESLQWYLDEVHPRVCRRLPAYRLIVAGRGAEAQVKNLMAGVAQAEYRGEFEDLVQEIGAARIGLAPLISGAGIRGKVNQYSAVGRPTVTTSIGAQGLPYVANESILVADSPGEFAERVIRLLEDQTLYESMRGKARAAAEQNFRWGAFLKPLEVIYVG